jgi:hypothetical protein
MSSMSKEPAVVSPARRGGSFRFHARDVTGTHEMEVADIQRGTPSGAVAQSLATRMELPTNVPWSLRDDATGVWLQDDIALDEQLGGDIEARLTLTPKTHLGGQRE